MATYEPGARTGTAGNDAGRDTLAPADMTRIMLRPIASSLPLGSSRSAWAASCSPCWASWPAGETVSGWIGLPLTAFALYGGLALLLEDGAQQTVLPLGRRGRARTSLEGEMRHQIHLAEREPGVRRQL